LDGGLGIPEMTVITCGQDEFDFRIGSFSTKLGCPHHVRFTPDSDRGADIQVRQLRSNFGHPRRYSKTTWTGNFAREKSTKDAWFLIVKMPI
jgi:hypothetical protein